MVTHAAWDGVPGLRHGFLQRAECTAEPWDDVVARAGVAFPVVTVRQVHGVDVVVADRPAAPNAERPMGDAVVTAASGVLVGVVTADGVPVLLVEPRRRIAAAVHAGWRGAAAGVVEAAIARMRERFGVEPSALDAAIGPAVGPCCYAVGEDVRIAFRTRTGDVTGAAWREDAGVLRVDLRRAVQLLLAAAGVRAATSVGPCTACDGRFSSYRRDGANAGRQLSFVGWA